MKLKLNIGTRAEADQVIDAFGDNQAKIAALQGRNRSLRAIFEAWAAANPAAAFDGRGMRGCTSRYEYEMALAAPALKMAPKTTREMVVGRLEAKKDTAGYVYKTYDSDRIKSTYAGSREKREQVKSFGLVFTESHPHLAVKPKGKTRS